MVVHYVGDHGPSCSLLCGPLLTDTQTHSNRIVYLLVGRLLASYLIAGNLYLERRATHFG